jgi:CHASE2 domain-containing sensor protein/two-component sensor histidine kinase
LINNLLNKFLLKIKSELANWQIGILPCIVLIILVILVRLSGYLQYLEWDAFDYLLKLRPTESIDERIVIIGINEEDIKTIKKYPIPDQELAQLIIKLQTYKPRVIGLDIIRDLPVEPGYQQLQNIFANTKNLIGIEKVVIDEINPPPSLPPEQVGFVDAILDNDNHLRKSLLSTYNDNNEYKFSLSIRLVIDYLKQEKIEINNGIKDTEAMRFNDVELPRFFSNSGAYINADAGGLQMLINFRSGKQRFRTISLNQIKKNQFNPDWLRDRIIIIGMTAPSVKDIINIAAIPSNNPSPGQVYGVEIQAHIISQIISAVKDQRPLLQTWSDVSEYLWIIFCGLIGITFSRLILHPFKIFIIVVFLSFFVILISYLSILFGWWLPLVPTVLILILNGIGLGAFYQYEYYLKNQLREREMIIDQTFDTIHNGPLQTLSQLIRTARENEISSTQLVTELEELNQELRAIYEAMKIQSLTKKEYIYLGEGIEINLQSPIYEILYEVYTKTLERDFPYFQTLKVKIRSFDDIEPPKLTIEQKRELCRFLEESLCNVGKYAMGVTRLNVTYTCERGLYILRISDNGKVNKLGLEGRGTQQAKNLARKLKGKFERSHSPMKGTICELTWPMAKKKLF